MALLPLLMPSSSFTARAAAFHVNAWLFARLPLLLLCHHVVFIIIMRHYLRHYFIVTVHATASITVTLISFIITARQCIISCRRLFYITHYLSAAVFVRYNMLILMATPWLRPYRRIHITSLSHTWLYYQHIRHQYYDTRLIICL